MWSGTHFPMLRSEFWLLSPGTPQTPTSPAPTLMQTSTDTRKRRRKRSDTPGGLRTWGISHRPPGQSLLTSSEGLMGGCPLLMAWPLTKPNPSGWEAGLTGVLCLSVARVRGQGVGVGLVIMNPNPDGSLGVQTWHPTETASGTCSSSAGLVLAQTWASQLVSTNTLVQC